MPALVLLRFPNADNLPKDVVQWQFAFDHDATDGTWQSDVVSDLSDFLEFASGSEPVAYYLGTQIQRGSGQDCEVEIYNLAGHLDGSPHGAPVHTTVINLTTAAGGSTLPSMASACLKFRSGYTGVSGELGPYMVDVPTPRRAQKYGAPAVYNANPLYPKLAREHPRARRRGRIFVGPLNGAALDVQAPEETSKIATGVLNNINASLTLFRSNCVGHVSNWSVWSRKDAAMHHVEDGGQAAFEPTIRTVRRREIRQ